MVGRPGRDTKHSAQVDQWPTHVKLCKAIGRGKPEEVKEMLKTADPNMDHVDTWRLQLVRTSKGDVDVQSG